MNAMCERVNYSYYFAGAGTYMLRGGMGVLLASEMVDIRVV